MNPVESQRIAVEPTVAAPIFSGALVRDLLDLAKVRITSMVVFTTAMGLWLAPSGIGAAKTAVLLIETTLLVASANILNCWYERETDGSMVRTRNRPLPAGRLDPGLALVFGIAAGLVALPALAVAINPLTALLGAIAHITYVLVYTPMKRLSPWALEVGAIPGAIPPLMGWTAATGSLSLPGWFLFGILFFWQIPHFLAIAIYLEDDYRRGGFKVFSVTRGKLQAARRLAVYTVALVAVSLLAQPLKLAGVAYTAAAAILGAGFLILARRGLTGPVEGAWARKTMLYSIVWLAALMLSLVAFAR